MTVKEMRQRQLQQFNEDYINNIEVAKHITNCFHRLCGLSEYVFNLQNNTNTCDSRLCAEYEEKEAKAIQRLNNKVKPYGLNIVYAGIYPSICVMDGNCIAKQCFFYIAY